MSRLNGFVRTRAGGARFEWIVLGAGLALLAVMVAHDLYQGARLANAPGQEARADESAVTMDTRAAPPRGEG